jgi:hypothetical protein
MVVVPDAATCRFCNNLGCEEGLEALAMCVHQYNMERQLYLELWPRRARSPA